MTPSDRVENTGSMALIMAAKPPGNAGDVRSPKSCLRLHRYPRDVRQEHDTGGRRPFRPWPWFAAWVAAGGLAALLVGGSAGKAFAAYFAAGAAVLGFYLWRISRSPRPPRPVYVGDHRPTIVIRVDPPVLTPRWWASIFVPEPWGHLVGEDDSWEVRGITWGRTFAVDAPPGAFTLEIWFFDALPTARLEVALTVEGTLYVTWQASWWFFFGGRIHWQPRVPDGVVVDGLLRVAKLPERRRLRRRKSAETST